MLVACLDNSKANNLENFTDNCVKNKFNITSFTANTYTSENSIDSDGNDHLYGAIYELQFTLPINCKDIFRGKDSKNISIELEFPKEIHSFAGLSSSLGNQPTYLETNGEYAHCLTSFSILVSRNEPVAEEELLKWIDSKLEFKLQITSSSNKNVLVEEKIKLDN